MFLDTTRRHCPAYTYITTTNASYHEMYNILCRSEFFRSHKGRKC